MSVIRDLLFNPKGEIDPDGNVRNIHGQFVGRVSITGQVKDARGVVIGNVTAGGAIYNRSGERVGSVVVGNIQNRSGSTVGMCDPFDPCPQTGGAALLLLLR
jgi:hypothetical protein